MNAKCILCITFIIWILICICLIELPKKEDVIEKAKEQTKINEKNDLINFDDLSKDVYKFNYELKKEEAKRNKIEAEKYKRLYEKEFIKHKKATDIIRKYKNNKGD